MDTNNKTDTVEALRCEALLGSDDKLMALWEAYEMDGPGCAMYLYKSDAEACEAFENGCDRVVLSHVRVSPKQLETLYARQPIFA